MPLEPDIDDYEPCHYTTLVRPWPLDDPTAHQYYWNVYYDGEPVNGGLCDNEESAKRYAEQYKTLDQRKRFLAKYAWDVETSRWYIRS